jgi:hypothetical protein
LFGSAAFLSTATLTAALESSVSAASDLNEEIAKSRQIFGDASGAVDEFARNAAQGLGISRNQALEATGTFGNLFTTVGLGEEAMSRMSQRLVTLGADLASFNNADISDVLAAIRSGLIGEAEPLRRFGVLLSETRVQQVAMAAAGKTNVKQLTDQEKALARYNIILEDTAPAHGDFERTSGGLANQTRVLKANVDDLSASLGGVLIDDLGRAAKGANSLIGMFKELGDVIGGLGGGGFEKANASFEELTGRLAEVDRYSETFKSVGADTETLAAQIRSVGEELNRVGATTRLIASFRQASEAIDASLRDGVITPLEAAQLETTELGRLFLELVPQGVLQGLGADVRSGIEDATASARVGVEDLGAEIRSGIEDASREAAIAAREGGETIGDSLVQGLQAASGRIQGQLAGLSEQVVRAQIAGDDRAELVTLQKQKRRLEVLLKKQEQIVGAGRSGAGSARERIRKQILPQLLAVSNAIERALEDRERAMDQVERQSEEQKRRDKERIQRIADNQQEAAAAAKVAARTARRGDQFEALGLTRGGDEGVPGVGALRRRLGNVRQAVEGTILDTTKTEAQLDKIAKVLSGKFGKVGRDVRQAILGMLNEISSALEGKGAKSGTKATVTKFQKRGIGELIEGLGLSDEEVKALRQRFAQLGPGGTVPGKGIGAFGFAFQPGTGSTFATQNQRNVEEFHIYIDGEEVESRVTKRQQRKNGRTAKQRRGTRPGI